ncbi:MAG TPA: hypothetical protein VM487_14635 [Phycisphaerae bacterium]|nr:hypothetical protein [Phycisphaerae bacterium]
MRMNEIRIGPSVTRVLDGRADFVMMLLDLTEPVVHTCALDGQHGLVAAIRVDDSPAEFMMGAPLLSTPWTPLTNYGQYSFVWELRAPFSKLTIRTANFGGGIYLRVLLSDVPFELKNLVHQSGNVAGEQVYDGLNDPATGAVAALGALNTLLASINSAVSSMGYLATRLDQFKFVGDKLDVVTT